MTTTKQKKRRFIVMVTTKATGEAVPYHNLKSFTNANPQYSYNTLSNYLSRQDAPFNDDVLTIERKEVVK